MAGHKMTNKGMAMKKPGKMQKGGAMKKKKKIPMPGGMMKGGTMKKPPSGMMKGGTMKKGAGQDAERRHDQKSPVVCKKVGRSKSRAA